jgi:hypothetical protein
LAALDIELILMARASDLRSLLELKGSPSVLAARVQAHPWDSDIDLVHLLPSHLRVALEGYVSGNLSAEEIELWANALECREDIGFPAPHEQPYRAILHALANPLLTTPLSQASAQQWLSQLEHER